MVSVPPIRNKVEFPCIKSEGARDQGSFPGNKVQVRGGWHWRKRKGMSGSRCRTSSKRKRRVSRGVLEV